METQVLYSSAFSRLFKFNTLVVITVLLSLQNVQAHTIESYTTSGCSIGSTVKIDAVVTYAPSNTWYHWQYKDGTSNTWKCFANGTNSINGQNFTVSGASWSNHQNDAPELKINNATIALEDVQVRCLMSENVDPCNPGNATVWGGDAALTQLTKTLRLHIYGGTDCGGTTPGCLGNVLMSSSNYYGGFEAGSANFSSSTALSQFSGGSANPNPIVKGRYMVLNNPFAYHTSFGKFAPHSGNNQMVVTGNNSSSSKVWYKTVSVASGAAYTFSAWFARIDGTTPTMQLKINGLEVSSQLMSTSSSVGKWIQLSGTYIIPTGVSTVEIAIYDKTASASVAHNYAIDDICFRQSCPPPAPPIIGDFVWNDLDNDGKQDAGEPGISNVVVTLFNSSNVAVMSTVTDANGAYFFSAVPCGVSGSSYKIGYSSLPADFVFTTKAASGSVATNNSDADRVTGKTDLFTLMPGQTKNDMDAGAYRPSNTLPIRLISFKGTYLNGTGSLNWNVTEAVNFNSFELERSNDAVSFNAVATINSNGKSTGSYQFTDKLLMQGANYYRLKMIDIDGNYSYSNIIVLNAEAKAVNITAIYPNPFIDLVKISLVSDKTEQVSIKLIDNLGRIIRSQSIVSQKGMNQLTLDNLSNLVPGIYVIEVITPTTSERIKLKK